MDALPHEAAYKKLVSFITNNGGVASAWYCGVTDDVLTRLKQHEIKKNIKITLRTRVKCMTVKSAVAVEARMHAKGCLGKASGPGGVTSDSKYVYVFKLK